MAPLRQKFYFLAPTTESPVNGPIFLGAIITHPRNADFPLNSSASPIDPATSPIHTVEYKDYSLTLERKRSFKLGIWASFLAQILGVGGDISGDLDKEDSESWSIQTLKTISFTPTPEYITANLENSAVKDFIAKDASWLLSSRLYMITGLKLAYGATATVTRARSKGLHLHVGVDATSLGVPVEAGPDIGGSRTNRVEQSFGGKTPFVLAFRLQRIKVSTSGEVKSKVVTGGMLGHEDDKEDEVPTIVVQGLEEHDASAADFEIDEQWEVMDIQASDSDLCSCSLAEP